MPSWWARWFRRKGGRRLQVVMYTRRGCHLCEEAWAVLTRARRRHAISLTAVDIDTDPALAEEHGLSIPVVVIEGRVRFRGRVNPLLLERTLRGEEGAL